MADVTYNRDLLNAVLIYHQRTSIKGCGCGWSRPGASYTEHVVDAYEEAQRQGMTPDNVREQWEASRG